jgi:hypothetical protein
VHEEHTEESGMKACYGDVHEKNAERRCMRNVMRKSE